MDKNEIKKYLGTISFTVSEVMQKININNGGVLFLIDEHKKLKGSITDGDIRRFLLAGGKMDANAIAAANQNPRYAHSNMEAASLFHNKNYKAIPVIDEKGIILDIYVDEKATTKLNSALNIPVVINAGGKGTRLEPYTRILPKPLIPIGDLPIIEHIMKEFQSYSCDEFHIIVNYKKQLLKAYFYENENNYNVIWYDENVPLGTGGGLSLLRNKLNKTFFFSNCDNLLRANYEKMLQFHRENKNVVTMICAYKNFSIPYGIVDMGVNGKIKAMREKPLMSFLANTGIYIVEPEVLDDIEDGIAVGFPDVVEKQRQKGRNVAVYPVSENEWMDMGQLSELEKMRMKLYGE